MTDENDQIIVNGDFVTYSSINHSEKLISGVMTIEGDFTQLNSNNGRYNFSTNRTHKIILSGNNVQNISFATPLYSKVTNFEINNKNPVNFKSDIYLIGTVYDNTGMVSSDKNLYISNLSQLNEYNFSGRVYLNNNNKNLSLEQDLNVGDITFNYLHLNGNKPSADNITVKSGIYVKGGTIECKNNLYFETYSHFSMMNDKDYVLVGGNFTTNLHYGSSEMLTDGVLEIKEDFIQIYNSDFICKENHVTILSGKKVPSGREYIQTIKFQNPGTSKFNILKITKPQYKVLDSSLQMIFQLKMSDLNTN